MERSDPVNGWPQRALSLREMMMMMMMIELEASEVNKRM
jgi:hypothetical protein